MDADLETITADQQKESNKHLVYISTETEYSNVAYMEGALLAFYLTELDYISYTSKGGIISCDLIKLFYI